MVGFLANALAERGHLVSVVGNYEANETEHLHEGQLTIYRLGHATGVLKGAMNFQTIGNCILEIHQAKPIDIVEGSELSFGYLKVPAGIQKVIRLHGGHHYFAHAENRKTEWRKAMMERRSFAKAHHFIAVSDFVGRETARLLGKNFDYTVINNPIDTGKFHEARPEKTVANRLVFVGTVVEKKGIRQLVQAMPAILKEVPDATLVVIGRHANQPGTAIPYLPVLQKEIGPEISDSIVLKGAVPHDEVVAFIESAEICVYPSHMEAMPLAWLEVLAMAKPFVGSNTGPGTEVVKHGETGLLCNPHDPDDISEKVLWLLRHKAEAAAMAKRAREDVQKRFDLNVIVPKNLDHYNSLLQ
jgi:glycosyltransferase involved in cell wall biosynthesis